MYGLSVGDQIEVPCSVSANPGDLTFHWFFNTTQESKVSFKYQREFFLTVGSTWNDDVNNLQKFINLPGNDVVNGSTMTVTYLARTPDDYGTLLCYASNTIGYQDTPCVSHIIPSGMNQVLLSKHTCH